MLKKFLRKISSYLQKDTTSFDRHNNELASPEALMREEQVARERLLNDEINQPNFQVVSVLKKNPQIMIVVDIGSGAGWASAAVAKYVPTVIALEPSIAGINIAKKLFPSTSYPNIIWNNGFAEKLLPTLELNGPTLFITGCVLSHLRDKEVLKICNAICTVAPVGSVFAFSECWSETTPWHQRMWHVRTKKWWQDAFTNWELEFGGPKHDHGDYRMGIWGVKK